MLYNLFKDLPPKHFVEIRAKLPYSDSPQNQEKPKPKPKLIQEFFQSYQKAENFIQQNKSSYDLYFGPAIRKPNRNSNGQQNGTKASFAYSTFLWADCDHASFRTIQRLGLPPTYLIKSGSGYHVYWQLNQPITNIEQLEENLKLIATAVNADQSATDCTRILRIPETYNYKLIQKPELVEIRIENPNAIYDIEDFEKASYIPYSTKQHLIKTPEYGDRSDIDWQVCNSLVNAGFDDKIINLIYDTYPVGEKHSQRDDYLPRTLKKIRENLTKKPEFKKYLDIPIYKGTDGYYIQTSQGIKRITPFTFDLKAMQIATDNSNEEKFILDIHLLTKKIYDYVIPSKAFDSSSEFRKHLDSSELVWPCTDAQTIYLKWFLLEEWKENNTPIIYTTSKLGRQTINNLTTYVTQKSCYPENNILYFEDHSPKPKLVDINNKEATKEEIQTVVQKIDELNKNTITLPILGWFVASTVKPDIPSRFPHLNIYGTRGAGKTTIINCMQRIIGMEDNQTWLSSTTNFVLLKLLGSSDSIPICLTEFRESTQPRVANFLQLLRTAYDSGIDARGQINQTIKTYPLTTPVCIDGEDPLFDPAVKERIIQIYMSIENLTLYGKQETVEFFNLPLVENFAASLLKFVFDQNIPELYRIAKLLCISQLERMNLPYRMLDNMVCVTLGLILYERFLVHNEIQCPYDLDNIDRYFVPLSLELTSDTESSGLYVDDFIEFLVNKAISEYGSPNNGINSFNWRFRPDLDENSLWFQMTTAYDCYRQHRLNLRLECPSKAALKKQLKERTQYYIENKNMQANGGRVFNMHGINLAEAHYFGLDIDFEETIEAEKISLKELLNN